MKKALIALFTICLSLSSWAKESINPTITPALFRYNDPITVTYDVTGTPLASLTTAWIWVWIPGKSAVSKINFNPASSNALTDNAKFAKSIVDGKTLFTITFTPSNFFESDISAETQIGILLKGNDWADGQTTDFVTTIWDGSFQVKLTAPTQEPLFVNQNDVITITAETPASATYELFVNDVLTNTRSSITAYNYDLTVTEATGGATVRLVATAGVNSSEASFSYLVSSPSPLMARPAGIIAGINYNESDDTKVTLCLLAPDKTSVYVRGDFSNWKTLSENILKKDGEFFWIELTGLTPGEEYAFQYIVDESLVIADPFSDKILSTDDQYIPASIYPDLKIFPQAVKSEKWYFNRASVFQTGQAAYNWQVTNFQKPKKNELVIYEVLIRDFFEASSRSYASLTDTLSYLKRLGVNAIELMPIMEFSGNESWGYNPNFMFAPDKAYGTKNDIKEFVDACHAEGIAVILDIAMNHQDLPNSYLMMEYDFVLNKPKAGGKYFNVTATHPYSVFFDMNHESSYTKQYLDTINHYWLNEYKVDGFRFDLSKGFTQTNNPNDVGAWGNYDASRIAILKRMADKIWSHTPDAYVILEHFAANSEEKELVEYRSGEGKGMMVWGNLNNAYAQNSMGFSTNSDINWISYKARGWSKPHAVGYMESHDEERMMFRNLQFGSAAGNYSIKNINTALDRAKAAGAFFFTIPGPKMLWQFGELGYDVSIDFNGRVGNKPLKWEYQEDEQRVKLYKTFAELIKLKRTNSIFNTSDFSIQGGSSLLKQVVLKNEPYTSSPITTEEMNVVVVGNFDVSTQNINANFPHTGKWFHYFSGGDTLEVTATPTAISLSPGEFRVYTDVRLPATEPELMPFVRPIKPQLVSVEQNGASIVLNWNDNSSIESGYKIYRKKTGGDYQLLMTTPANITTYSDKNSLEALTEYQYYVQAFNGYNSSNSAALSVVTSDVITPVERELDSSFVLHPVPTTGKLQIKTSGIPIQRVTLLDTRGMRHALLMIENGVDVSNFSAGLYFIEITTNKGVVVKKIVKQ